MKWYDKDKNRVTSSGGFIIYFAFSLVVSQMILWTIGDILIFTLIYLFPIFIYCVFCSILNALSLISHVLDIPFLGGET